MKMLIPLVFLVVGFPLHAGDSGIYRFSRPIQWQGSESQVLLAVPLDGKVYAATRDGFPDLRLIDDKGVETPFLLGKIAETKTEMRRFSLDSHLDSLKKKDKAIEILLTLDKDAADADGLTVATPLTDFEHRLQVFGSKDGVRWTELVKNADIFDYSSYMAVSHRDVAMPANTFRKFKVVIEEATQARESELLELSRTLQKTSEIQRQEKIDIRRIPLKIDRIDFWRTESDVVSATDKPFEYPVARFNVSEDATNRTTIVDVETSRQPLTGLKLGTPAANFKRQASVQIPVAHGVQTVMQTLGSGTLEALHFRDINRDIAAIPFPEQRRTGYRIVIHNFDNPPLAITSVIGIGTGYQLIYMPAAGRTYSLHYGSDKAKQASYETDSIRELLRKGYQTTVAELEPEASENALPQSFDWAGLLNSRLFLGFVVVLMVIALGWALYRVGTRIDL